MIARIPYNFIKHELRRDNLESGDSNGSLMVAVPETANTTEYGGTNGGCNIHHSNTCNQLYVPVVQRKQ